MDTVTTAQTATATTAKKPNRNISAAMRGNKNAQKPEAVRTAVVVKAVQGQNNEQIAQELEISRHTVRKILNETEIDVRVKEGRSRCIELIPKAIDAVESGLDKRDARIGLGVLNGTKVLNSGQTVVNQVNIGAQTWVALCQAREAESAVSQERTPAIETSIVPTSRDSKSE